MPTEKTANVWHEVQLMGDKDMPAKEQKNKRSIIYKSFIILASVIGILLQCGIGTAHFSISSFRMFTTLSNFAVAIFFTIDIIAYMCGSFSAEKYKIRGYFKFLITMAIVLTGLVAHFMLRGMFADMDTMAKAGLTLLHYVVPIGTVLDWLLFDEKGKTEWKMPIIAAIFPVFYVVVTMIAAQIIPMENKYPYPFLDVDRLGMIGVMRNIMLLAAVFLAAGYIGVWLDHKIKFKI